MSRHAGLLLTGLGALALLLSTVLLALAGGGDGIPERLAGYVLAIIPVALILHAFFVLARGLTTARLLLVGAATAALSMPAILASKPEALAGDPGPTVLAALSLADLLRVLAAASLGLVLARYVSSPGVALLIAALAAASDLFSVFAGPTKALLEGESPALDFLLLIFPTLGQPLGFGLGLSDFIFLALFGYSSYLLKLRYRTTLACCCGAILLSLATGLLIQRPLPVLPFIALAFVLANAAPIFRYRANKAG